MKGLEILIHKQQENIREKIVVIFYRKVTVWKLQKNTLTLFWQKFHESNVLNVKVTKELVSRNILTVRVNFSFFHTVRALPFDRKDLAHVRNPLLIPSRHDFYSYEEKTILIIFNLCKRVWHFRVSESKFLKFSHCAKKDKISKKDAGSLMKGHLQNDNGSKVAQCGKMKNLLSPKKYFVKSALHVDFTKFCQV